MSSQDQLSPRRHNIFVEHLDPELEEWQILEYNCIADESNAQNWEFMLLGLKDVSTAGQLLKIPKACLTNTTVEDLYSNDDTKDKQKVCLLDPKATQDLAPEDAKLFDTFLFGGILGDDPPRDRTSELRKLGFAGRRLGTEQMTTDTAARVTRMVIEGKQRLEDIRYVDRPDIKLPATESEREGNADESVSMPFRYVKRKDGTPVMPNGMVKLLAKDAEKDILDLL